MRALPSILGLFAFTVACSSAPQQPLASAPVPTAPDVAPPPGDAAGSRPTVAPTAIAPPMARRTSVVDTLHGTKVPDPYRWLEKEKAPEVQAWMTAQDRAARAALAKLPHRAALRRRFKELYYVESISPPRRRGDRLFYVRTHKDREKAIVYWRQGEHGAERVLLDPNAWSPDGTISLGVWVPSWDGRRVAFAKRPNAADEATLHVLEVDTGTVSRVDVIPGAKYAHPRWTPDSKGFYYEWLPVDPTIKVSERPGYTEIRYHALGTDPKADRVVHPRTGNPSTFLTCDLSRDGRYLFAYIWRGWSENDIYIRDLRRGTPFRPLVLGKDAVYTAHAWKGQLYIHTNEGASRYRIFKVRAAAPARRRWREIVAEDPEATLEEVRLVGGRLVLGYLRHVVSEIRVTTLSGKPVRRLEVPPLGSASGMVGLEDHDVGFFSFSSFTMPPRVYRVSMKSGAVALWAEVKLPIDPSPYAARQVFFTSKDGTRIPMFLVGRRDLKHDGRNPVLLYGYGGFTISLRPRFSASIYPWLEAGGVFAMPNLRGGGEYGKAWHDAGRGHRKQNVFDDFIAAAEHLVGEKITSPPRLAIYGGSNGGLLVGAGMTQRPDLFRAVVCAVPLLDMVRYHLFGSGRTWIPEYGTAEKEADFRVLFAYSPYHRVRRGTRYPALLMLSADHDDRVDPMHARKFVAAVRHADPKGHRPLLRIERNAGHGGADQVRRAIEVAADRTAFLMAELGM